MVLSGMAVLASCSAGGDNPGSEYAPNMYHSFAYEPLSQEADKPNTINANGLNMREPVKGTIARGQLDYAKYDLPKTAEGSKHRLLGKTQYLLLYTMWLKVKDCII